MAVKTLIQTNLGFTVTKILDEWTFLDNVLFLTVLGYDTALGSSYSQSRIIKVSLTPTSNTAITSTVSTIVGSVYGNID